MYCIRGTVRLLLGDMNKVQLQRTNLFLNNFDVFLKATKGAMNVCSSLRPLQM